MQYITTNKYSVSDRIGCSPNMRLVNFEGCARYQLRHSMFLKKNFHRKQVSVHKA